MTIIQVTNTTKSTEAPSEAISLLNVSSDDSGESTNEQQFKYNVKINPSSDSVSETPKKIVHIPSTSTGHYGKICNVSEGQKVTVTTTSSNFATNISVEASPSPSSVYEQVFITTTATAPVTVTSSTDTHVVNLLSNQARSASHSDIPVNRPKGPEATTSSGTPRKDKKSPQKAQKRPMLTRGATEAVFNRPSRIDKNSSGRSRVVGSGEEANSIPKTRFPVGGQSNEQDHRKRSSSTSDAQQTKNGRTVAGAVNSAPGTSNSSRSTQATGFRPPSDGSSQQNMGRLTLREQQVMHMRREMMHPGGVRLQLRRKDCLGSIAWVDAFGAVW